MRQPFPTVAGFGDAKHPVRQLAGASDAAGRWFWGAVRRIYPNRLLRDIQAQLCIVMSTPNQYQAFLWARTDGNSLVIQMV